MSPSFRPTSFGDSNSFSGREELSHAGLHAGVESQLTKPTDIGHAHQFFTPGSSAANAVGNAAIAAPVGHAAIAAPIVPGAEAAAMMPMVPGASEPVSPLIQLIMRMPGQLGLMSSFFEAIGNFFMAHLPAFGLDPSLLDLHAHVASLTSALHLPGAEHFAVDPSMLPDGAPIMHNDLANLNHFSLTKHDGLIHHSEPTDVDPRQVAGEPNVNSPQFEGTDQLSQPGHHLSGPTMSDTPVGNHLSGTQRLFSDRFQGSFFSKPGMQNSLLAGGGTPSSVSVSSNSALNVSGSAFGAQPEAMPAVGQASDGMSGAGTAPAGGSYDSSAFSSSSYGGADHSLVATNGGADTFRPTYGTHTGDGTSYLQQQSGAGDASGAHPTSSGHEHGSLLKPLHAKELSLDSLTKSAHKAVDTATSAVKSTAQHATTAVKQATHAASSSGTKIADTSLKPAHHADKLASAKDAAHPAKAAANKLEAGKSLPKATDKSIIADKSVGADKSVVSDLKPTNYTIRAGDCLWNIAKDHLGSAMKWQDIYNMNQDVLGANPDLIHTGATIKLPGSNMDLASAGTEATKYVVKPGDCLWDIAKDQMHDATKWGDLYKANADVIGSNARLITPGEELMIPGTGTTTTVADAGAAGASSSAGQLADASGVGSGMAQTAPAADFGSQSVAGAGDGSTGSMAQTVEIQPQVDMQAQVAPPMQPAAVQPAAAPPSFHHMVPTIQGGPGAAIPAPAAHVSHLPGPGAAGAATLSAADALPLASVPRGIVNSSLGSDIASFLGQRK